MDNIVIRYLDHPKLDDPTCIEGLPGIGNVGKLAEEHLKDELKAVKFAEIFSKYFPPQVLVQEDGQVKLVNNEMHYVKRGAGKDLVLITGDYQGLTPAGQSRLSAFISRALTKLDVLTKYLGIEISFNELEAKAKQIDQITSKLKDIEAAPEPPDKREDLGYIG